jgi:hypothetical protein
LLVTNQSEFPVSDPAHWAVFDIFVGERGLPLYRPHMRLTRRTPQLSVRGPVEPSPFSAADA